MVREQAEGVDLIWKVDGNDGSFVEIHNESRRPIRDVSCRVVPDPEDAGPEILPDEIGNLSGFGPGGRLFFSPETYEYLWTIRVGERGGFRFRTLKRKAEGYELMVRFTDDAGLH